MAKPWENKGKNLDLEFFLKNNSEEDLLQLKAVIDNLLLKKAKEKELSVPLSIFSEKLNPGEAIVKYLKEEKGLKFSEISKVLLKKENAVWLNYKRANENNPGKLELPDNEKIILPINIFSLDKLSYLETIVFYLRTELRLSNNEISNLLKKSPQVLSIAYNRAKSKMEKGGAWKD